MWCRSVEWIPDGQELAAGTRSPSSPFAMASLTRTAIGKRDTQNPPTAHEYKEVTPKGFCLENYIVAYAKIKRLPRDLQLTPLTHLLRGE